MAEEQNKRESSFTKWLKRLGFAGFLFFFVKGLVWLALLIAATYFGFNLFE